MHANDIEAGLYTKELLPGFALALSKYASSHKDGTLAPGTCGAVYARLVPFFFVFLAEAFVAAGWLLTGWLLRVCLLLEAWGVALPLSSSGGVTGWGTAFESIFLLLLRTTVGGSCGGATGAYGAGRPNPIARKRGR